ncbi:MAG: polysaccharide deacetylase [Candidatus Eremiobacteraeota bacterium]|nr:polysaccharide deacetylase [Candidatus Eremiobacteraeota bacterium]
MKRKRRRKGRRSSVPALALVFVAIGIIAALAARTMRESSHVERAVSRTHRVAVVAKATPIAAGTPVPLAAATEGATPEPTATPAASAEASPAALATPPAAARLALIIDDCGQWPETERGFIALPVALTLSVLPQVRYSEEIARSAHAAGKGVMLHLPMEPRSGVDPGPGRITTSMDDAAIAAQVSADIADVPLATGVNNHEGSRATSDDRVMRDIAAVLAEHHLFFIDSRTIASSVAARDAVAAGVPSAARDVFLDDVADVDAVKEQLRRAAAIAKERGSAIAIGHPRASTLLAVQALLPELERDGISFVDAADLAH